MALPLIATKENEIRLKVYTYIYFGIKKICEAYSEIPFTIPLIDNFFSFFFTYYQR